MIEQEPAIYYDRKGKVWRTAETVVWFDTNTGCEIVVPEGFKTDLASVPRILHPIVSPGGAWNRAAIIHDYLYSVKGLLPSGKKLTRKQCDRIFLEISILDGANPFITVVGYYGIRFNPKNWSPFRKW